MPNKNKLAAMAKSGYRIVDSCMTCSWGPTQPYPYNGWGQCRQYGYHHTKHEAERPMPAHVSFICENHIRAPWVDRSLGEYAGEPWKEPES